MCVGVYIYIYIYICESESVSHSVISNYLWSHGQAHLSIILQARIMDWVAMPFSRESSQPRDWTQTPALKADSLQFKPLGTPPPTHTHIHTCMCVCVKSLQSCLTLFDPKDCCPLGFSVHGDSPGRNTGVGCHALFQNTHKAKAFDCVDHNKLWKILKEMEIPDHLICLLRNLHVGLEATVRTGHGKTD